MATATRWVGPFRLRDYLENCMSEDQQWPPESNGVYVVSIRGWRGTPKKRAGVLYVGGNTSKSPLFLTRVGSLIADMLGFWWHHSGGQSLWKHCRDHGLHPLDLYLGWVEGFACPRCAERQVLRRAGVLRFQEVRGGRLFSDYTERGLRELMAGHPLLTIERVWVTEDVRPDKKGNWWLNAIIRKSSSEAAVEPRG
jgi:hypothetical protein